MCTNVAEEELINLHGEESVSVSRKFKYPGSHLKRDGGSYVG